jgi:regulatory protein
MENLKFEKDEERQSELVLKEAEKLWYKYRKLDGYKRYMKVKQSLYQKGFDSHEIDEAIEQVKDDE